VKMESGDDKKAPSIHPSRVAALGLKG
jgi:hypothetical protein